MPAGSKNTRTTIGFFGVSRNLIDRSIELGMDPACSLIVIAAGTAKDNRSTSWSCHSVKNYTSISRQRSKQAVKLLLANNILSLKPHKNKKHPKYRINHDTDDEMIWLPKGFVTGVSDETPPLERLRQTGDVLTLKLMLDIYAVCSIAEEGGLPWDVVSVPYKSQRIGESRQYTIWGFTAENTTCYTSNELVSVHKIDGEFREFWRRLTSLEDMGLVQLVVVAFDAKEGAVMFELDNVFTDETIRDVALEACEELLPEKFHYAFAEHDVVIPVISHVVSPFVRRLYIPRYKQDTELTRAGYALVNNRFDLAKQTFVEIINLQYQGKIKGISREDQRILKG